MDCYKETQITSECIIIISHSNYKIKTAGVEKFIGDISGLLLEDGIHTLHIFPIIEINKRVAKFNGGYVGINVDGVFEGVFYQKNLYGALSNLKNKYNFDYCGVHINHLHGWNLCILGNVLSTLAIPIKIIVHDYEMICPFMLKGDGFGNICRSDVMPPNEEKCKECKYSCEAILRYKEIREFLIDIFDLVESVIAPSDVAMKNWLAGHPEFIDISQIRAHLMFVGEYKRINENKKIRIAYCGTATAHKGYSQWLEFIDGVSSDSYDFYYFGKDIIKDERVRIVPVDFQNGSTMTECLRENNIDCVFLWPTLQETYSYVAYEAYVAGCFLVTNLKSGNVASMVRECECGVVFESLEECKRVFADEKEIEKLIRTYISNSNIPGSFQTNSNISALVFKNNASLCQPYEKAFSRAKALVMTKIYMWMRIKN